VNSRIRQRGPVVDKNTPPPATEGEGKKVVLSPQPTARAMDVRNMPSAVLELAGASAPTGTWLVSPWLELQEIKVGDRTWRVGMRWTRAYHPFSVQLLTTTHEVYRGTDKPKNFQSRVRIENPERKENREVDIYMNNPLRYEGLTFYQYQMGRDELDRNRSTSTLQVVRNPSWLTPYIGCATVGGGLVIQFMLQSGQVHLTKEESMKKWLPWLVVIVAALWIGSALRPPKDPTPQFDMQDFGRLPAVFNGRFQPLDSIARNSLLQMREKQSIYVKNEKRFVSATEWLIETLMDPKKADDRRIFRIDHGELRSLLKLPDKDEAKGEDGKHYTWAQIEPSLKEMEKEGQRVAAISKGHRTPYERAVLKLQESLFLYMRLKNTLQAENTSDFAKELSDYKESLAPGLVAVRAREAGKDYDQLAFTNLLTHPRAI